MGISSLVALLQVSMELLLLEVQIWHLLAKESLVRCLLCWHWCYLKQARLWCFEFRVITQLKNPLWHLFRGLKVQQHCLCWSTVFSASSFLNKCFFLLLSFLILQELLQGVGCSLEASHRECMYLQGSLIWIYSLRIEVLNCRLIV